MRPSLARLALVLSLLAALGAARPATLAAQGPGPLGQRHFKSGPIQVTADGAAVWVALQHADAVARIRPAASQVDVFPLPAPDGTFTRHAPKGIAVTEDGARVYVTAHDSDRVLTLDGETGAVLRETFLRWGAGPYGIALSRPDADGVQRHALIAAHRADALYALDLQTGGLHDLGPVFRAPIGLAWTDDPRGEAWVTHLFADGEHGRATRVDGYPGALRVATELTAFAATPRDSGGLAAEPDWKNVAEGGYVNFRGHPAQPAAGDGPRHLWLPAQYHNMHTDEMTPDTVIQASLRKIDLDARALLAGDKVHLTAVQAHDSSRGDNDPPWQGHGWDAQVSGCLDIGFAGRGEAPWALVVCEQSDDLVLVPADASSVRSREDASAPGLREVPVGRRPMGLAVSPTRPEAFVYNDLSGDVSVVDLSDPARAAETRRIAIDAPPVDGLEDPELLRGAELFYGSTDPRTSAGKVSCASCHINGEHDGRDWAFQHLPDGTFGQGHGPRPTNTLLGIGRGRPEGERDPVTGWGLRHRSGDRDEIQDFEHTFRGPLMGGEGFLGDGAQPELGPPNAGRDADLDAMTTFLRAQPPLMRSPGRNPGHGMLDDDALRGATMFLGAGEAPADARCATCHDPETNFEDFAFHDVGQRRDGGEAELNDPAVHGACLWCVSTPSLVGAWHSAPWVGTYGWAGSLLALLQDFARQDRPAPHGRTAELLGAQLRDLAAFLRAIDGDMDAAELRGLADREPPRIARILPTSALRFEVIFDEAVSEDAARPEAWRLERVATGQALPLARGAWSEQNGDRITLFPAEPLIASAAGEAYVLAPALPIRDRADDVTGGVANAMDPTDPSARVVFRLPTELTISLGASGYENLIVRVHDSSPVGPNLSTWNHDHVALFEVQNGAATNPGFLRFDWREAFREATGVRDASALLAAELRLRGENGDAQRIELRRALQAWADPLEGGGWNRDARGAPTWRDHSHPDGRWNQPGARALGSAGDRPADYDGPYDLAETVDAVAAMPGLFDEVAFQGPRVDEAFRFWFAHPEQDYGYALRLAGDPGVLPVAQFHRWETDLHDRGPTLRLTYRVPGADGGAGETIYLPAALR